MKQLFSFLILFSLCISLAACASGSGSETKAPITPPGAISVNRPDTVLMNTESFKVTDKMVAYSLKELYLAFCEKLAESGLRPEDMGIVAGTSLKDQECLIDSSAKTWLDYFANQAEYSFMEQLVLCEAAAEAGISLGDGELAIIDARIEKLAADAAGNGKTTAGHVAEIYGTSVNTGDIRDAMELSLLAEKYLRHVADSADVTAAAINRFYTVNSDAIDTVDYLVYVFTAEEADYAQELAEQKSAEDFLTYVRHHVTGVRGLSEVDFKKIRDEHVVCENVHRGEGGNSADFAFSAASGDVNVASDKYGSVTVTYVTRAKSPNEATDADGNAVWMTEARAMIESEYVKSATEAAAKKYPVTVDRQNFYSIDIKG